MIDNRKQIILMVFVFFAVLYTGRLFYLQVIDTTYKSAANANSLQRVIEYPYRGLIYDRKGKELVLNVPVYDIMLTPRELPKNLDTLRLANVLGVSKTQLDSLIKTAKKYSRIKPTAILKQVSHTDTEKMQEQLVDFSGITIVARTVRGYPHTTMANALGYIGEISKKKLEQTDGYYRQGDYIGLSGLELEYEEVLRGRRGVRYEMVDVHGINKGKFKEGAYDTTSIKGQNLYSSIDLALQQYGDSLMVNKAGSIVAIEPQSGEILAFISAPTYNPNLLSGRAYAKNFRKLMRDQNKPLFNRALMAMYRPGSTFKTIQALVGLQEGVIDSNSVWPCIKNVVNCHPHPSPCNLSSAIQWSCNPYFLQVYKRNINQNVSPNTFKDTHIGYDKWRKYVQSFGLGAPLGVDLPNEKKGILPSTNYFDKVYGPMRWKYSNMYSISIGEGELGILPLQLANQACILANRGWYRIPHFIKAIGDKRLVPKKFRDIRYTGVDAKHFIPIVNGMEKAVQHGTVWSWARIKDITVCGKTGTSQNAGKKDHSIFIGFAPKDNPKIAIAVFVEYGGFGGFAAAPIGTLMIEKYLKGKIVRKNLETHMMNQNYIQYSRSKEQIIADSLKNLKFKADSTLKANNKVSLTELEKSKIREEALQRLYMDSSYLPSPSNPIPTPKKEVIPFINKLGTLPTNRNEQKR